jgi:hypothetical protein
MPVSDQLTAYRVIRGGSRNNNPRNCRSADRNRNAPANRNNNLGFRVPELSGDGGFHPGLNRSLSGPGWPLRMPGKRM